MPVSWKESYDKPRQRIKKQRHHFVNQNPYSQSYGFSSSHVKMWELDHKGWVLKNWCFWTVVLEKILESLLDSKEVKPVNPKGNQPWIFTGRTDAEAEAPILWPPDAKMLERIEGRRRRGQQRMRQLDGITDSMDVSWSKLREIVKDNLVCRNPWGHKSWTQLSNSTTTTKNARASVI